MIPRPQLQISRPQCLVLLALLLAACSTGGATTATPGGTGVALRAATSRSAPDVPLPVVSVAPTGPTTRDAFPSVPTEEPESTVVSTPALKPTAAPEPPVLATEQPRTEEVALYTSERSGLSFERPSGWAVIPQVQTQGTTAADQVALLAPGGDALLLVQVFQLKRTITEDNRSRATAELDAAFATLARRNGGRVRSSAPFRRGGLRGYEYRYTFRGGKVVRAFAVLAGNRQVNVQLEAKDAGQRAYAVVLDGVLASLQPGTKRVAAQPSEVATPGRYESPAGTFAFSYPRTWTVLPVAPGSGGANNREAVALRSPDNRAGLIVSAHALEREVRTEADLAAARSELDAEIGRAARELGGAVVSVRPFTRGALRGFEYQVRFAIRRQSFVGHQYHLFSGDTRYSLNVETPPALRDRYEDAFNQVLSSLEVPDRD